MKPRETEITVSGCFYKHNTNEQDKLEFVASAIVLQEMSIFLTSAVNRRMVSTAFASCRTCQRLRWKFPTKRSREKFPSAMTVRRLEGIPLNLLCTFVDCSHLSRFCCLLFRSLKASRWNPRLVGVVGQVKVGARRWPLSRALVVCQSCLRLIKAWLWACFITLGKTIEKDSLPFPTLPSILQQKESGLIVIPHLRSSHMCVWRWAKIVTNNWKVASIPFL